MKRTLNDDLTHVGVLDSRIRKWNQKIAEYSDKKRKLLCEIREAILSGGTTENKITDFIIAKYGYLNPDYSEILNNLESRLKGKIGQYVLLVEKELKKGAFFERKESSYGLMPPPSFCSLKTIFSFGVISDDSLCRDIKFSLCFLPLIGNRLVCTDDKLINCQTIKANLLITSMHLDRIPLLDNIFHYEGVAHRSAEFFVGDEDVKRLFSAWLKYEDFLSRIAELLCRNEKVDYLKFCHKV